MMPACWGWNRRTRNSTWRLFQPHRGTAAAEFHSRPQRDIVWNCWTGALAHLGAARANALESRTKAEYAKLQSLSGNAADAAVVRSPNRFR
jgi:hypothetical protein